MATISLSRTFCTTFTQWPKWYTPQLAAYLLYHFGLEFLDKDVQYLGRGRGFNCGGKLHMEDSMFTHDSPEFDVSWNIKEIGDYLDVFTLKLVQDAGVVSCLRMSLPVYMPWIRPLPP